MSLPSPGSHWKTSSPAPSRAVSLPWLPSMKSLPSPPRRRSAPLLPRMVSLPVPPSTVTPMRAAKLPVALKLSSPPFILTTSFSLVPMSMLKGAGVTRSKRTRVPLAVAVKISAPLPPLTSTVSVPSPPSARSVSSPGFQIMRSSPASPNIWSSPSPPVIAAEQHVVAALAEQSVVAGLAEQLIVAGAAREDIVAIAAEQVGNGQRAIRFVERERIVAALTEDLNHGGVGDGGCAGLNRHGAAVDQNGPGRVAAGRDHVVESVAELGQHAGGGAEACGDSHCLGPF